MVFIAGAAVVAGGAIVGSALAPSPPATPDYAGAATAQGSANLAATRLSTQINRPNEITPYGSRSWYQGAQPSPAPNTSWTSYPGGSNPNQGNSTYGMGGSPAPASNPYARSQINSAPAGGGSTQTQAQAAPNAAPTLHGAAPIATTPGGSYTGSGYQNAYSSAGSYGGSQQVNIPGVGSASIPYGVGGMNYDGSTTNSTGYSPNDQWTSVESLSPVQQQLFDSQNRISQDMANVGEGTLGSVQQSFSSPASSIASGLNPLTQSVNGGAIQNSIGGSNQDAYNALMARQNTQLTNQENDQKTQLANQGITPGSDAYNRAMMPIEQSKVDAANQAQINATQLQQQQVDIAQTQGNFANTAQAQQFSQGLQSGTFGNQARAQGLQENQTIRELPANELNALRSGAQVQAPQFQQYNNSQSVQPTPILQGAQLQGAATQQTYANQIGQFNNTMQGIYGLGGALINY